MTYQQTLDWLFHQLASFQRVGKSAYNEDLGNITALCRQLNNPHKQFKSIHIAGTNGKGSTAHLLASILQEQGYKVGLYTSPHLVDFRERIKVNGAMIAEHDVVDFVAAQKETFKNLGVSFFEMTTALAFQYFASQHVDLAVIETGLGGRLDATNLIQPELSIITNVALDHQNLLGNTVKEIATEKAGIIKENTPVVVGPSTNEVKQLMRSVAELNKAPLTFANLQTHYKSALLGACQHENTATVVAAVNQLRLRNWSISETALSRGLAKVVQTTKLRGRWEQIATSPKVICDTGHNLHAMQTIAAQLQKEVYQNLWIVLGLVADKDVSGLLALMPRTAQYVFCQASIPRALNAEELAEKAAAFALKGRVVHNPKQALQKAQALANEKDLIFVGGSTFVVAEIL